MITKPELATERMGVMAQQQGARRTRRGKQETAELSDLRARRDELDAALVDRRRREDVALERYVAAAAKVRKVHDVAEVKALELERQATAVRERATADAAAGEAEQAAALLELQTLGRSADELAQLTGIAVKRVRAMIRSARTDRGTGAEARVPEAAPKGRDRGLSEPVADVAPA